MMSLDSSLTNLAVLAVVLLITLYICWQSCVRSGFKRTAIATEALRFLLIGLAAFTLFQPTFISEKRPEGDSVLKVLIDVSNSMTTEDVERNGELLDRATAIQTDGLDQTETWEIQDVDQTVEIDVFAASRTVDDDTGNTNQPAAGNNNATTSVTEGQVDGATDAAATAETTPYLSSATNLHEALDRVASSPGSVRSVVLISDGDWNLGASPSSAARKLRQLGIPVHTIGTGSPVALPDLAIVDFDLPTFTVLGKSLQIPFAVKSTLESPVDVEVTISLPGGDERKVPLQVAAGGTSDSVISWEPTEIGDFEITVSVPEQAGEHVTINNQRALPINVRHESLKVLMVDSFPRWEYRYTRNALMRDPGVTVNTLLLHPDIKAKGGGAGYLDEFPSSEQLTQYDAVFLGDIGMAPGQLTPENCDDLIQLVRNHAAGLVFLPGFRGFQSTFLDTPMEELLPVELDIDTPKGTRSAAASALLLTESGSKSLLTRLESNQERNREVWNSLPGFFWSAATVRAKPNTNVLAVHKTESNRFGRLPIVVTRTFGTGKVLFVGTDSAWRWRKGVEDRYHYRFWSQMVRWMAYQRTMAAGESMRVIFTPDRPRTGDTVNLLVNAMDSTGEPLQDGTVATQVLMPSGKTQTLSLKSDSEQSWGLFRSSFVATEGGKLKLITSCRETGDQLETEINVRGVPREKIGQPARLDVMQEIASITQGRAINLRDNDLGLVLNTLGSMPPPEPLRQYYQLWSHPLWGLLLIALLGAFWGVRKLQGLV